MLSTRPLLPQRLAAFANQGQPAVRTQTLASTHSPPVRRRSSPGPVAQTAQHDLYLRATSTARRATIVRRDTRHRDLSLLGEKQPGAPGVVVAWNGGREQLMSLRSQGSGQHAGDVAADVGERVVSDSAPDAPVSPAAAVPALGVEVSAGADGEQEQGTGLAVQDGREDEAVAVEQDGRGVVERASATGHDEESTASVEGSAAGADGGVGVGDEDESDVATARAGRGAVDDSDDVDDDQADQSGQDDSAPDTPLARGCADECGDDDDGAAAASAPGIVQAADAAMDGSATPTLRPAEDGDGSADVLPKLREAEEGEGAAGDYSLLEMDEYMHEYEDPTVFVVPDRRQAGVGANGVEGAPTLHVQGRDTGASVLLDAADPSTAKLDDVDILTMEQADKEIPADEPYQETVCRAVYTALTSLPPRKPREMARFVGHLWAIALAMSVILTLWMSVWLVLPIRTRPRPGEPISTAIPYYIFIAVQWWALGAIAPAVIAQQVGAGFQGHARMMRWIWKRLVPGFGVLSFLWYFLVLWFLETEAERRAWHLAPLSLVCWMCWAYTGSLMGKLIPSVKAARPLLGFYFFSFILTFSILALVILTGFYTFYLEQPDSSKLLLRVVAYPFVSEVLMAISRVFGTQMVLKMHENGVHVPFSTLQSSSMLLEVYVQFQGRFLLLAFDDISTAILTAVLVGVIEVLVRRFTAVKHVLVVGMFRLLAKIPGLGFLDVEPLEELAMKMNRAENINVLTIVEVFSILTSATLLLILATQPEEMPNIYERAPEIRVSIVLLNVAVQLLVEAVVDYFAYVVEEHPHGLCQDRETYANRRIPYYWMWYGISVSSHLPEKLRHGLEVTMTPQSTKFYFFYLLFFAFCAVNQTIGAGHLREDTGDAPTG